MANAGNENHNDNDGAGVAAPKAVSVLFVCLGNICRCFQSITAPLPMLTRVGRSPMAEAVFRAASVSNPRILHIDSAGMGAYHTGDSPDPRTMRTLENNGITQYRHAARKVTPSDFMDFDFILAMDMDNLRDLQRSKQRAHQNNHGTKGRIRLFGDFGGRKGEEVMDPYYGANDGFDIAYEQMVRFSQGFSTYLIEEEEANQG